MRRKLILALFIISGFIAVSAIAAEVKAIKSTRINDYQLIVSCHNGRTPTVSNMSGSIFLSCTGQQ
jgi:hypothetical protein